MSKAPDHSSTRARAAKAAISTRGGTLYGFPAKKVRDVLRVCHYGWKDTEVADILGEGADLQALRAQLVADGFLDEHGELTPDGFSVMNAKAQKRIPRSKAEKALAELLERVEWVNTKSRFSRVVQRVIVFGSYLSDASDLGDVDVMVEYRLRFENREQQKELEEERREIAIESGRVLNDFMAHLYWPERETGLYLKAKDRVLSFSSFDLHENWIKERPHKVIYELTHPTPLPPKDTRVCTQGHESAPVSHVCATCQEPLTETGRRIVKTQEKLLAISRKLLEHDQIRGAIPRWWTQRRDPDFSDSENAVSAMRVLRGEGNPSTVGWSEFEQFVKDLDWTEDPRFWRNGPGADLARRAEAWDVDKLRAILLQALGHSVPERNG